MAALQAGLGPEPFVLCRATQEMAQAVAALQAGLAGGQLQEGDVTPALLQRCLHTRVRPKP